MELTAWGRYPRIKAQGISFDMPERLAEALRNIPDCIAYGMGRSYGDCALNQQVIFSRRFDSFIAFDPNNGILSCEAGITLAEIIDTFLPKGWFLSVTPGTKFVSIGGAIAADVHGKNHHVSGCFSECVLSFDLMLPDGSMVHCSREQNPELFFATCGGMGLTGIIVSAEIRLQPVTSAYIRETVIPCRNLEEVFYQFEANQSVSYSVAWLDCLAMGENIGRSVLMLGEHADTGTLILPRSRQLSLPFDFPGFCLNRWSVSLFNRLYYRTHSAYIEGRLTPLDQFFYPLDKILHWNRMYGRNGFTQYQLVLPKSESLRGLQSVLTRIAESGMGSFLAVLKLFGSQNRNYLSFPMEGYTLTLDFKIEPRLFPFLDELDKIVLNHGGRLYMAKDVRMNKEMFRSGYPGWKLFSNLRKNYKMNHKFNSLQSQRLEI